MADVMQEVQQAGATDPAAQKMLLDELQGTKPELWPLVVQQFRSSASYHQQLSGKTEPNGRPKDVARNSTQRSPRRPAPVAAASTSGSASARIGDLVDPRSDRAEAASDQPTSVATPANMSLPLDAATLAMAATSPKSPQPLVADPLARPIATAGPAPTGKTASAQQVCSTEALVRLRLLSNKRSMKSRRMKPTA